MADFTGTIGADMFDGGAGNNSFFMQQGGDDDVDGAGGSDGFYFGSTLNGRDIVFGGTGAGADTLALQGNYRPPLGEPRWELPIPTLFGVREVEVLLLLSGSDTRFGDTAGNNYDYDLVAVDTERPECSDAGDYRHGPPPRRRPPL